MAAAYFGEGGYGSAASVIHPDSAHPDHIVVPDAQLLFTAHFHHAGPDLVLTGRDGHSHIIPGYFSSAYRPALVAPNGALLSPDLVELLAGSAAPNEYAQTGQITPPEPIGRVEKVVGNVTVVRNGVAVALNVGDAVYKSDVVQTDDHSSAGVAFPDGSALNLVANSRMALSEYSYDPNSTSNSALFNLVEGGLSFVAGKVAHTGDMKIGTPIASLGIRGTAGWLFEDQVATVTANAGNVTLHFAAVFDSVTNTESTYTLYAIDANGQLQHDANGNLISLATVSSTQNGLVTTLTGNGINAMPSVTTGPPDITQQQFAQQVVPQVINMAIQAIQQYQQQQQQQNQPTNPQSNPGNSGSSTPPPTNNNQTSPPLQQIINLNNGSPPLTITAAVEPTPSNPPPPPTPQVTPPPTTLTSSTPTWNPPPGNSTGSPWTAPQDWSPNPPGPTDSPQITSSTPALIDTVVTIQGLTVDAGTTVAVVSNSDPTQSSALNVAGTAEVAGTVKADSTFSDPAITFNSSVTIATGGEINAHGSAASVTFTGGAIVDNSGLILADGGGNVVLANVEVTNETGGIVEATDANSLVTLAHADIVGGTLETGSLTSAASGEIEIGPGTGSDPSANLSAFDGSTGGLTVDAFVQVDDGSSLELLGSINNAGTIALGSESGAGLIISGLVTLTGSGVINLEVSGSIITGAGDPSDELINSGNTISGTGTIEGLTLENQSDGVINANVAGETFAIKTTTNAITNAGAFEATNGGELSVQSTVDDTGGTVTASGGFVDFYLGIHGGNATITSDGKLEFGWSSDLATNIIGSGTLVLDHQNQSDPNFATASYTGTVSGFGQGAVIDVTDLSYSTLGIDFWNGAAGALIISNATGTATVSLAGSHAQDSFALTSDGGQGPGTELIFSPTEVTLSGLDEGGNAVEATPVTATLGDNNLQNVTYTWLADGAVVQSGISNSYTPVETVEGQALDVLVSFTDPNNASATDTVTALAGVVSDVTLAFTTTAAITGTPQEGQTLTAVNGTLNDSDAAVTGYQWQSSSDGGTTWSNITNGTSSTYTVAEADENHLLRVVETATDSAGGLPITSTSAATAAVLDAAPTVTTPIITGTAEVGLVLTAAATAGQSDNTVSYQWFEDSGSGGSYVAISGATGASYQVQPNDNGLQIEVQATVINDNGTTVSATSAATAPVIGSNFLTLPSNSASTFEGTALALTNGHVVDSVPGDVVTLNLSVADGTLTPIDTTLPAGVTLDSESAAALQVHGTAAGINTLLTDGVTYTPNPNFTGSDTLTVAVSATSGATASEQVAITINPINVTAVTISGAAQEGQTLTADASSNDSGATFHYQWESSSNNFQTFTTIGTDSATYVVQESDEGNAIRVVASSADPENNVTSSLASTATALVLDAAPTITTPVISGTAQEGDTLTAAASAGQSDNSVSYQWLENDGSGGSYVNIAGATGVELPGAGGRRGLQDRGGGDGDQ